MIYSSIEDNWIRVQTMFLLAKHEYTLTANTDERAYFLRKGAIDGLVGFCPVTCSTMRHESCIVGMLMVWTDGFATRVDFSFGSLVKMEIA